ncbi:MAG: hypothetical protein ACKV2Q_00705 [Planctomycetaceae bacterium]
MKKVRAQLLGVLAWGLFSLLGVGANHAFGQVVYKTTTWTAPEPTGSQFGGYVRQPNGDLAWVATFPKGSEAEIESLYRQLVALKKDAVSLKQDRLGLFLLTTVDTKSLNEVAHGKDVFAAAKAPWTARLAVRHIVALKEGNGFSLSSGDGTAEIIDRVRTTLLKSVSDAYINWDPLSSKLTITVVPIDAVEKPAGPKSQNGRYQVVGTSTISTLAKTTTVDAGFAKGLFNFGASTDMSSGKSRLRVSLDGFGFNLRYGSVFMTRRDFGGGAATLTLTFGTNFLTDIDSTAIQTIASSNIASCKFSKTAKLDVKVKDKYANVNFSETTAAVCVASASQRPVSVTFSAIPGTDPDTNEVEGASLRSQFQIESKSNGETTGAYQVVAGNRISWTLKASVQGDGGGTINVAPNEIGVGRSRQYNIITLRK